MPSNVSTSAGVVPAPLNDRLQPAAAREIGGVAIAVLSRPEALARLLAATTRHPPEVWGFCNAHTVNLARRDVGFRAALRGMTILNDGVGVDLASRLLFGAPFPENLNGTDMTPAVLAALRPGARVFLIGARPDVAKRAAAALRERYPALLIVGTEDGYFGTDGESAVIARIAATSPELVLVGMGQPQQELFATRLVTSVDTLVMCVGAFLDFAAGDVSRAPGFVRALRFEWAYRLLREPRRLAKRYLIGNGAFLLAVGRERLRQGRR